MASDTSNSFTQRMVAVFAGLLALVATIAIVGAIVSWVRDDSDGEVSWLYSQTADTGELDDLGGGKYRLVMHGIDAHTIQFSDRPDRLVEIINTGDFVHAWDTMFASSAPNAVLVEHEPDGSTDSLVVVLTNPLFDLENNTLSYDAEILADEKHPERLKKLAVAHAEPPVHMSAVSLFIDSVSDTPTPQPIFTGPAADALRSKLGLSSIPNQPLKIGGNVQINSATVTNDANGVVTATAKIGFSDNSFTLNMKLTATDAKNWTLTAFADPNATPWTVSAFTGLSIDPNTFTGTITSVNGAVAFDVTASQHTWTFEDGATITSTPRLSSACPLEGKCPTGGTGPYLTMNGNLVIASVTNSQGINISGGMSADASWVRFEANLGSASFGPVKGTSFGPVSITSPTITIWHGQRSDSYDVNMSLPSLQSLTGALDVEFCGGFSVTLPKIGNQATNGCARWAKEGVVIGQVVVADAVTSAVASTATTVSSQVKGLAWTNLTSDSLTSLAKAANINVTMGGVVTQLMPDKIVLAGKTTLPGVITKALGLPSTDVAVDVTGTVSSTGFSLNGTAATKVNIGNQPFKVTVNSMNLSIDATSGGSVSFSMGTSGTAVLGYGTNTKELQTSVQLVAATAPNPGFALSVTARGTAAPGETADGLTAATALTKPSEAQYVWKDQFGIKGLNLWNMTVQISYAGGFPALGYTSTTYMDPNGQQTKNVIECGSQWACTSADWMVGQLAFNISSTNPCLAYSFTSSSNSSMSSLFGRAKKKASFVIDGGVIKATTFKVGIAPTGCQIQSGDQQVALPAAFAGFQFDGTFANGTQVSIATQVSANGFEFNGVIADLKLAGFTYTRVMLTVSITNDASQVTFAGKLASEMGNMDVMAGFSYKDNVITQALAANLTNWSWGKSNILDIPKFQFNATASYTALTKCASFSAGANGQLTVGSSTYSIVNSRFTMNCNKVTELHIEVIADHQIKWNNSTATATFSLDYNPDVSMIYGSAGFTYERGFSAMIENKRFRRTVRISVTMSATLYLKNQGTSGLSFDGNFSADRVSGEVRCDMTLDFSDFTCGGTLRVNPSNSSKMYRFGWGDL